jgi:very-short-patch-repair endonuclease
MQSADSRQASSAYETISTETQSSPIEDMLAEALAWANVPYVRQFKRGRCTHDFAIPEAQLIIECDGYDFHHTKEDCDRDARRDFEASLEGWEVKRITGSQIWNDAKGYALKIKYLRDTRIDMLNLAVSKSLCGEYAWPTVMGTESADQKSISL